MREREGERDIFYNRGNFLHVCRDKMNFRSQLTAQGHER